MDSAIVSTIFSPKTLAHRLKDNFPREVVQRCKPKILLSDFFDIV